MRPPLALSFCVAAFCGFLATGAFGQQAQEPACAGSLSPKQAKAFVEYVRKKYRLPDSIALTLKRDGLVAGTCFRELTFQGKSELRTWDLTLFASPDLRFLATELFDTHRDPLEEERARNEALMKGLTQGAVAVRGPDKAAVTIVEFSDFQCPHCRKFAGILDEALAKDADDVRVVFHHLPLGMHNWARAAAEGAACAQIQGKEAFWSMHDQLFREQEHITPDNLKQKLAEFAGKTKGLDTNAFQQCMSIDMSLGIVLKDINLAASNEVNGTPTLFINGHRVAGVENADKLRTLIAEARKESKEHPEAMNGNGAR